ncbi:hypothetical protein A6302_04403 [Methylobrevis pamukkalensis]|uniref:Conserved hypothetical protein CHP03032 domain-containing protein n=1 Tax=Methylobrevis pamukkalensis TaxID=1439726 RepID=A0A1E3GTJ0_9HYPH|nr:hypothetical protein A6302_04403 [Methylobrevis pamukkalensis]
MSVPSPDVARAPVALTGSFDAILRGIGCAVAVASYQSSLVAVLSVTSEGPVLLLRSFDKPMGLAATEGRLAVAARNEIVILADAPDLARTHGAAPGTHEHLWLPRSVLYSGEIDLHDPVFAGGRLIGAATRFSCIAGFDDSASLTPIWSPPFISQLVPEDRCHLNGLAVDAAGAPRLATALGTTDVEEGWRAARASGGALISIPDGQVLRADLSMPHSPRLVKDHLLVLTPGPERCCVSTRPPGRARCWRACRATPAALPFAAISCSSACPACATGAARARRRFPSSRAGSG